MRLGSQRTFLAASAVLRAQCVCDVGSMDAEHARLFRRRLRARRVVAFEANPRNYAAIVADPAVRSDAIEVVEAAATNTSGDTSFNVVEVSEDKPWARGTSSLLTRGDVQALSLTATATTVPAVRLDEFFADEPGPLALWIDVEGAAYEVIEGLAGIAARVAVIHVEVETQTVWEGQRTAHDVIALARSFGLHPIIETYESTTQRNLVLVRTSEPVASALRFLLVGALRLRIRVLVAILRTLRRIRTIVRGA